MLRLMTKTGPQYYLVFALLILCSPFSWAESDKDPVILILGDSLSAAYRMDERDGWVHLLNARIQAMNLRWHVVNASVSGETTAGGLSRLPALLETHQPAVVILQLGGNDGLRGLPVPSIRQNLLEMVDLSRRADADVLLAGIQIPPNYGPRYTEPFAAQYREIAEQENLSWLPFLLEDVAEHTSLMQDDGIHPTEEAQPIILDNIWSVLLDML